MGRKTVPKPTYDAEDTAERAAMALIDGNGSGLRTHPALSHMTEADRNSLQRAMKEPIEIFNARLSEKLRCLADRITDRIGEKLDVDAFKPGELPFALSVVEDKRVRLDGTHALNNASVNQQVNNFFIGSVSKDALLASLDGRTKIAQPA